MAGARGGACVNFPTVWRGADAGNEKVCDSQPVLSGHGKTSKKMGDGIIGENRKPTTGRSLAAREGQRGADLSADRESKRGPAGGGAETAHSGKCGGWI